MGPVAMPSRVALRGIVEGGLRSIDAKPDRLGPFVERGEQQRAGPGAKIEDPLAARGTRKNSTAATIRVSLSGRGTSTPGPTARSIVQKAR